ncbi:MAG: hypothetical protein J6N53_07905 [Lachnospiraceae bacterium]|nr:hypothetical protein [Lachnospiraceae bacterium]MBP3296699.1 hypothetical protein [Lachnospiraceae bacterium]
MPPKEFDKEEAEAVQPIGDLNSVPHFRCGLCHEAVVLYQNDERPMRCRWCGFLIDWKNFEAQGSRK